MQTDGELSKVSGHATWLALGWDGGGPRGCGGFSLGVLRGACAVGVWGRFSAHWLLMLWILLLLCFPYLGESSTL